ncbi:hypothetical protein ALC57_04904, partial [Trachymyrmex cornetzi]
DELIKRKLPITTSRSDCIDRLVSFYERFGTQRSGDQGDTFASNSQVTTQSTQDLDSNPSLHSATMEEMQRSMILLMAQMQKQQHMIERITSAVTTLDTGRDTSPTVTLATNQCPSHAVSSQPVRNLIDSTDIMENTRNVNVPPPMASASPAQAVKLLANQISVFAGTEDDIEVTLLAASSKLTKNAREWFDLDDGQVNDSWSSFKSAIPGVCISFFRFFASPSKLLLGYEMKNHSDSKLIEFLIELVKIQTTQDQDLPWLKERDNSRKLAIETTDKIKEYNKIYFDRNHKAPKKYKAGEHVRVKDDVVKPGESKKLKSDFKGPYMIDKVLPHNRYVVKDIQGLTLLLDLTTRLCRPTNSDHG